MTISEARRITRVCWSAMIWRCHKVGRSSRDWWYYRGQGISVYSGWRKSFEDFVRDVGLRPSLAFSIDRFPNRSGNYEPGNVRWATKQQQTNNRTLSGIAKQIPSRTFTVRFPTSTGRRLKIAAMNEKRSMKDLIVDAIEGYLKAKRAA